MHDRFWLEPGGSAALRERHWEPVYVGEVGKSRAGQSVGGEVVCRAQAVDAEGQLARFSTLTPCVSQALHHGALIDSQT